MSRPIGRRKPAMFEELQDQCDYTTEIYRKQDRMVYDELREIDGPDPVDFVGFWSLNYVL